jgi:hypothetical protein
MIGIGLSFLHKHWRNVKTCDSNTLLTSFDSCRSKESNFVTWQESISSAFYAPIFLMKAN